jgi:hypothetical protein
MYYALARTNIAKKSKAGKLAAKGKLSNFCFAQYPKSYLKRI